MALSSGKVGVDPEQVDEFGVIKENNVTFKDLTEYKIKLDTSLLTASDFSTFKTNMLAD